MFSLMTFDWSLNCTVSDQSQTCIILARSVGFSVHYTKVSAFSPALNKKEDLKCSHFLMFHFLNDNYSFYNAPSQKFCLHEFSEKKETIKKCFNKKTKKYGLGSIFITKFFQYHICEYDMVKIFTLLFKKKLLWLFRNQTDNSKNSRYELNFKR